MEEETAPPIRNMILDGGFGYVHIVEAVRLVWPRCVERKDMIPLTIYMDKSIEKDWHRSSADLDFSKDISLLQIARIPFGEHGWTWIVSFHNCDEKHVIPLAKAFMKKLRWK